VDGRRPAIIFNEIGLVARAERGKKGCRRGRVRVEALHSGRQCGAAGSSPWPVGGGTVVGTGASGGARPTRCGSG
jgi:hypothetical protein